LPSSQTRAQLLRRIIKIGRRTIRCLVSHWSSVAPTVRPMPLFSLSSVDPTLYKSMGPTRHNDSAPPPTSNPNPLRTAAVHRAPSPSPPPAKSHAPVPPPQPSVPADGSLCSPPAAAPLPCVQSRARSGPVRDLRFHRHRGFRPGAAVQVAGGRLGGAQGSLCSPQ
jgi:hypothetical protein